jgi:hypothetical protein
VNTLYPNNASPIIYQTSIPDVNIQPYDTLDYFWKPIVNGVLILQPYQKTTIPKFCSTNPSQAGFVRTYLEEHENQLADYRLTLPDGRGIHLREFADHYVMHWDKKCPLIDPIGHINQDAPQYGPILAILALAGIFGFTMLLASSSN